MIQSNTKNTREDLEKDNERLQKQNWELKNSFKVGCSNTDHNSLYFQLETSNNENDRLKQDLKKLSEENDNHNIKMDLLLNKIESLANINDKLNTKIENYSNKMDLLTEKIVYLEKVNESQNTKIDNVNKQLKMQQNSKEEQKKKGEQNRKNIENYNNLLPKIESLAKVYEKLNNKIENVNQQQNTLKNLQHNCLEKLNSFTKANESQNQQLKQQYNSLNSKLNEQHLEINDKVSETSKEIKTCKQDLLFLIYKFKSNIMEKSSFKIFNDWIDDSKTMGFELLYESSEDDFEGLSFHSACDGKGATITLIETTKGDVFGGYNSQSWNSDNKWYGDDKCFIFTLVNKHGIKPTKYSPGVTSKNYVKGCAYYGPLFGSGFDSGVEWEDIRVSRGCSYQSFPLTFDDTTGKGNSTLTPSKYYDIKTIEIYKCI
ncbi:hypothetical protein CYY_009536 [Polysphondylium violaceum]|uniref:TLDc domain-containing protein n=1 Tax=Polysphondylium violaceum TaxID=133409 RepID=A0A8J4PL81_9MYCE|nr:hypothetical protein CYY_009536 [Polysphondylium violaceum]